MKGFVEFLREQGVMGLAIAFILGAAITKVVNSLVEDIINPVIGVILGFTDGLGEMVLVVGPIQIRWGSFVSVLIDFAVIAAVVYFGFKFLKLDKIDAKKDKK